MIRSAQRPGVSPKISFSFSWAKTRPRSAAISARAAIRSMTWVRWSSDGSPGGTKNENTRTIGVPSSRAMSAIRRIRSSSGPSGAPIGILPMGDPMAETRTPASASMARKAASWPPVKSATLTDHALRSSRCVIDSAASVASCSRGSGEISSANPLSVTVTSPG